MNITSDGGCLWCRVLHSYCMRAALGTRLQVPVLFADSFRFQPIPSQDKGEGRSFCTVGKLPSISMNSICDALRAKLGYKTPNQVFFGIDPPVALAS